MNILIAISVIFIMPSILVDLIMSRVKNEPYLVTLLWLRPKIKNQQLNAKQAYKYDYLFFNHFDSGDMIDEYFIRSDADLDYVLHMYSLYFVLDDETVIDDYNDLIDKLIKYLEACCDSLLCDEYVFDCQKCLEVAKKYKGLFNKGGK